MSDLLSRQSIRIRIMALLLLGSAIAIEILFPSASWLSDILLTASIAVCTYVFGWIGGLLSLALAPFAFARDPHLALGEWIECALIVTVVMFARRRIHRFHASESKLRGLLASMDDVILILDAAGTYVEIIPTNPALLYRSMEDMIGRRIGETFPPHQAQFFLAYIHKALIKRTTVSVDYSLQIDDRLVWFSASVSPLDDHTVIWVARDITARKTAEKALQESHARLDERVRERTVELSSTIDALRRSQRQLADAERVAHVGSFEQDVTTKTLWWSAELYRMFGLQPSELPMDFDRFLELVLPEDRPIIDQAVAMLMSHGEHEWEVRLRASDGTVKATSCRGRLVNDPPTGVTRLIGTVKDVTEQRRAEQRLRDSEERFRLVARATSDAVWDLDMITGKVWRGDGYETLFGYSPGELAPTCTAWLDRVHADDRRRVQDSYIEAVESGQPSWSGEYRFLRADGSYAYIVDHAYIVRDEQRRAVRMLGAMMDLSERKQLEEQLEQAKRVSSLGRVAASIAHEFNNVLMGIQPNVEVIQRKGPAELGHITENMTHAVRRGKRITDEILRFTRPTEPTLQCIDVAKFFERWTEEVRPLLGSAIEMRIQLSDKELHVLADPLQIGQVFTNLALNARDAMPATGGTLAITAELAKSFGSFRFGVVKTADRFVHFTVRDNGCGISPERMEHIFEPLFTTKKGGVGLGLSISYQVVTRHQGHIFVESEVDRGTAFHVFLPRTSPVLHVHEPVSPPNLSIRRLLLVEDEPAVASGIAMLLQMEGIDVQTVSTGGEAVSAIERFSPDAVILDIGLPDMDGVHVYLDIHQRWPRLPVLFSSGHGDSAKLETYLARPNVGFILKPYDYETLRKSLGELSGTTAETRGENPGEWWPRGDSNTRQTV